jgi:XTP/dITP diphosphohydrolase
MKVVLATHNNGKIREFQEALSQIQWEGIPISDIAKVPDAPETGHTFMENAKEKAAYYAHLVNMPVLAEDSGIIADALGNEPGIYSARYAGTDGEHGTTEANNQKLIERMRSLTGEDRKGHYTSAIALIFPDSKEVTAEGTCYGIIRDFYQGHGGFGYDPLFYLPQFGKTMAELTVDQKNQISHRGKALRLLVEKIKKLANKE